MTALLNFLVSRMAKQNDSKANQLGPVSSLSELTGDGSEKGSERERIGFSLLVPKLDWSCKAQPKASALTGYFLLQSH